jgi:hypothetical protein
MGGREIQYHDVEEEGAKDTTWWHSFVCDAFSNLSKIPSINAFSYALAICRKFAVVGQLMFNLDLIKDSIRIRFSVASSYILFSIQFRLSVIC